MGEKHWGQEMLATCSGADGFNNWGQEMLATSPGGGQEEHSGQGDAGHFA